MFLSDDFCFALVVSFVAGAALFGSAFLIPSFAVSVLSFTPTDAGLLLLPSSALFVASLLLAACLMQFARVPPIATVPFGIVLIMLAMWMLSGSNAESGMHDMMAAILLRGLGLGFLFLSITLVAFTRLDDANLATGIGALQRRPPARRADGRGGPANDDQRQCGRQPDGARRQCRGRRSGSGRQRLARPRRPLMARGLDAVSAARAAAGLLGKAVAGQSTVIAFDSAFIAVALLFVVAAPVLVSVKIGLSRYARTRAGAAALA